MPPTRWIPEISSKQKSVLYDAMKSNAVGDFSYFFLVALAAIVATLGLLLDSTAIIIGAMLISPIMKPILGMSFSVTTGDTKLFSRSIESLIFGAIFAISISIVVTLIVPTRDLTNEILSRTKPTVIDLFVAFVSGAAGAYIMQNNKDLTVLPGVAIATALMPPLCVVGAGVALTNFTVAVGGFLLFLSNLIAINLAAALIFKLVGMTTKDEIPIKNDDGTISIVKYKKGRMIWSITAFIIISIPLTYFLYNTINTEKTDKMVDSSLKTVIGTYQNVDLVNYNYKYSENTYKINAVVRSNKELYGSDIINVENYMERVLNKPTEVTLKIIFATDVNALTTPSSHSTDSGAETSEPTDSSQVDSSDNGTTSAIVTVTSPDKFIQYTLEEKCKLIAAELIDFSFSYSSEGAIYTIKATISGDEAKINSIIESITTVLEDNLNRKVKLSISAQVATAPSEAPMRTTAEPSDKIYDVN